MGQLNEVLYKLSDTENNNTNKYKASIFDGVVINDVNVIRGKATIDFGAGYIQLSHTQEVYRVLHSPFLSAHPNAAACMKPS